MDIGKGFSMPTGRISRFSAWLYRVSNGRVALVFLAVFLIFTGLVLPRQAASSSEATGGAGSPDQSLFYSAGELYELAEAYGEDGRQAYIRARFTFDVAWPVVYTLFLVTSISWLFKRGFSPRSWALRLNLVPVAAAGFDFLENLSTSLVMFRFPQETAVVAQAAPFFTLTKWGLVSASFVLLLVGLALTIWRRSGASD